VTPTGPVRRRPADEARVLRILVIAPLPPPVTGHSLASKTLVDALQDGHETVVVDLSIGSLHDGAVTVQRVREVGRVLLAVWRRRRWADVVYLTISESRAGNLKDLCLYLMCVGRLRRVFVHLHGGTLGHLFERHPALRRLNGLFLGSIGGVIVTGPSHRDIFAGLIDPGRVHVVPNSAEAHLFVAEPEILQKFAATGPLRVLYLSGMTREKGYHDLLEAWLGLGPEVRSRVQLDFAGRFETEADRAMFLERIARCDGVRYHGVVGGEDKRRLLAMAHVFCLPTRMREGQPISILEAYAAGCVVVTTGQRGIRDVFTDQVNGFEVEPSPASIAAVLAGALDDADRLRQIGVGNRSTAGERYRAETFTSALIGVLEGRMDRAAGGAAHSSKGSS
jgi:glycosyltransferase involved in cell wall biosynthesis